MKGIILAGGHGTRLYPSTEAVSKQLLPVYNKPMVYYPLTTLMLAGIRDILVITRPEETSLYRRLLQDGADWGLQISYAQQPVPNGIAEAFRIGSAFIGESSCALVLGDNVIYGHGFGHIVQQAARQGRGATIFAYTVKDPERYGVVTLDKNGRAVKVEEKPAQPETNTAIVGLYFFDNRVKDIVLELRPSARGELEITDILRRYLEWGELEVVQFGRGYAWFNTGTHESLLQASVFVHSVEERQGLKIACPEEVALNMDFIDAAQLRSLASRQRSSPYRQYLLDLIRD